MSTATETIIVQALANANVHTEAPDAIARQIIDALEARGYALRKKPAPRKPAAPAEVFAPNTGNPDVDAFMRRNHRANYRPLPLPKSPGMPPATIPPKQRDAVETEWARACAERADEQTGPAWQSEDAEVLRDVIALHRSPWRRGETRTGERGEQVRVSVSPQHPGIEIRTSGSVAQVYIDGELGRDDKGSTSLIPRMAEQVADGYAARRAS